MGESVEGRAAYAGRILCHGHRYAPCKWGVLARMTSLSVAADEYAETKLVMRESKDEIQVIGSFNSESLFAPCDAGFKVDTLSKQSLLQVCGRGYL